MVKIQKKNKKDDKIKQQRTRKTLAEKLEIIQLRENGAKICKIAFDKSMNEASVRAILKRKDEIKEQSVITAKYDAKSKKWPLSRSKLIMEKSLSVWVENCAQR